MRDYMNIGSSPTDEDCAQVGEDNYRKKALLECLAYIKAIKQKLGAPPPKAKLSIKAFQHDFGTYHEVVCYFEDDDKESLDYALLCEGDSPATWAEVGTSREAVLAGEW